MDLYKLEFEQVGVIGIKETYNVLAESLSAALVHAEAEIAKDYAGYQTECVNVVRVARNVISPKRQSASAK